MRIAPLALAAALTTACAAVAADEPAQVTVDLKNRAGASVGSATLTEAPDGVLMRLQVQGLEPGWHGLHFHETGDCSAEDFTSAGGHVHAASNRVHGLLNPEANEAGDLPNLHVDAQGRAQVELFSTYVDLRPGGARPALMDADGSAIVIHAQPDDHKTQPIGGAGPRVACGVIPQA